MTRKKSNIPQLYRDWRMNHSVNLGDEKENRENFLRYELSPIKKEIKLGPGYRAPEGSVSLRESYDLFQELAQLQENKNHLLEASESWAYAGKIAEKAKAPKTAEKLFLRSAEALEKAYGPTTHANRIWDRRIMFKQSKNAKRYAEILDRDWKYVEEKGGNPHVTVSDSPAHAFYEAGEYSKAADSAPHSSTIGMRSLKKAGRYEDLARTYDSVAEHYAHKGNTELASRFEINAKRIRKKGLEKKLTGSISVLTMIGGTLFLSSNITGNVIGNLTNSTSNFVGAGLLIIGLIAGFFWLNSKNK